MAPPPLTIQLFGPLRVMVRGEPLPRPRTRSIEWLLALLVLRHGHAVSRPWLAGTLWPESDERRALQNLRNDLVALRKALGPEGERLGAPARDALTLDLAGAEVDLLPFDAAVRAGDEEALRQAVALYRGPLLEGCVEEWVLTERESRAEQCLAALETLAERAAARAEHRTVIGYLRRAETLDPVRDSIQRALMAQLAAAGDPAAAMQVYRDFRHRLQTELVAAPDAATTALFHEIREATRRRAGGEGARGRGREGGREGGSEGAREGHDGAALAGSLPRSLPPSLPRALPRLLTPLIGRAQELAEVCEHLRQRRLVTLTGEGGVGKSRLALEVAVQSDADFRGGVYWVELAALTDGARIVQSVAAALGIREESGEPPEEREDRLVTRLADGTSLLALDNCEHVLDAAARVVETLLQRCSDLRILATSRQRLGLPGEVAWRVPSLAAADPDAVPLDERGAVLSVLEYPAVALFVERAAAIRPGYRLHGREDALAVAQLCRRLDGIPLAIELAAARTPILTVGQIADRLDDRFRLLTMGSRTALPRHQTLRALIDWSYEPLSEAERALLCRLSVFAGGWTLEAAENMGDFGFWILDFGLGTDGSHREQAPSPIQNPKSKIQNPQVLDLLDSLADRSLIVVDEVAEGLRYGMLETLRAYVRQKLAEAGEEASAREQHFRWFLGLAEEARAELFTPRQEAALARLEAEHDNLRAALEWARASSARQAEHLRLASALWPFWLLRGYLSEGREHLRLALGAAEGAAPELRAPVLLGDGTLANEQSDFVAARSAAEACLALYRNLGDERGVADALLCLGTAARLSHHADAVGYLEESLQACRRIGHARGLVSALAHLGRGLMLSGGHAAARPLFEEGLATARALGDEHVIAQALANLGTLARYERDLARALDLLEQSRALFQRLGRLHGVAGTLEEIALVHEATGELERAMARHEECVAIWRRLGNRSRAGWERCMMGNVAYRQGDREAARRHYQEGRDWSLEAQNGTGVAFASNSLGVVAFDQGDPARARELHREALAIYRDLDHTRGIAWSLGRLGMAEAMAGDPRVAARLFGAMSVARAATGATPIGRTAGEMARVMATVQAKLDSDAWDGAWQEGCAMKRDDAIAWALGEERG